MIKVSIVGAAGYAGEELIRILLRHTEVKIVGLFEIEIYKGKKISELYPNLKDKMDLQFEFSTPKEIAKISDLVFLALPHTKAMDFVPIILSEDKKVIDFSADYRINNPKIYEKWYKVKHKNKELLKRSVYGLPEIYREKIKKAHLVANPGCFPTSAILGLAPIINKIYLDKIYIDAKTGVSGAGRGLSLATHFGEVNENIKAYNIGIHRHTPEIEEQLSVLSKKKIIVSFTPHLIPINRGILSTIYATPFKKIKTKDLIYLYKNYYEKEPFVRVYNENEYPTTKYVLGSNYCDIGIIYDERTKRIVIISCIDNLVKGAAGQAVQNMNIMFNFDEKIALEEVGVFP